MQIVAQYDPTIATSGQANFIVKNGGKSLFINESYWNQKITFQNGQNFYLPANDRRFITFTGQMAQPGTMFTWQQLTSLAVPNAVTNQVIVESYEPGEPSPEVYPSPLLRQLNAAGAVGALISGTGVRCTNFIAGGINGGNSSDADFLAYLGGELYLGDLINNPGILNLDMAQSPVVATGNVAGSITRYAPFGSITCNPVSPNNLFKMYIHKCNGYNNNTFKDIALPNNFTSWIIWWNVTGISISFNNGATPQNGFIINGFFTTATSSTLNNNAWGSMNVAGGTPIDTIRIGNTGGSALNGATLCIGV